MVLHEIPFIRALGAETGWYRVGPLARMNTASFIDTPLANAAHGALRAFSGGLNHSTLANHWARMIEVVHCVERSASFCTTPTCKAPIWWPRGNGGSKASA